MKPGTDWRLASLVPAVLLAVSCSATPPNPIAPTTNQLIGYFDAKSAMASKLESYFTGANGTANYHLVALNGPVYPIGTLVAANNPLEIESRACQVQTDHLPVSEPWANQPFFKSDSKLDLSLAVPAPLRGVFQSAQTSLGAGIKIEKASAFGIGDISQTLLSRADLREALKRPDCAAALEAAEGSKAVFVRGIVQGQETLSSERKINTNLGLRVMTGETGQFSISYDTSGAYELKENGPHPKFAIIAQVGTPPADIKSVPPGLNDPLEAMFKTPDPATRRRFEEARRN